MDWCWLWSQFRLADGWTAAARFPVYTSQGGIEYPGTTRRDMYGPPICLVRTIINGTLSYFAFECICFAYKTQNVLLDIYVFVLPIPTLAALQMPRRKKISVISVFAFGAGSVIMGILRFHSVLRLISIKNTSHGVGETLIVVALELNLAAIAVNLPAIRSISVKRSNKRREKATLTNGGYGGSKSRTKTMQSANRLDALRAIDTVQGKNTHEMGQVSSPLRPLPPSDSQEELWRNIENVNGNVTTQKKKKKKKMSRHEHYTTVDLP
jgi:hypothetical protein